MQEVLEVLDKIFIICYNRYTKMKYNYLHNLRYRTYSTLFIISVVLVCVVAGSAVTHAQQIYQGSATIEPTRSVIPKQYGVLFPVEWGGGSLYQLKADLATRGCIMGDVVVSTQDAWGYKHLERYNQYGIHSQSRLKQRFLERYEHFIPASTIQVSCYNVCEFRFAGDYTSEAGCFTVNELFEQISNLLQSIRAKVPNDVMYAQIENFALSRTPFDLEQGMQCRHDWHPVVQQQVFSILPLPENVCIIRGNLKASPENNDIAGLFTVERTHILQFLQTADTYLNTHSVETANDLQNLFRNFFTSPRNAFVSPNVQPYVYINERHNAPSPVRLASNQQEIEDLLQLQTEIHELCHANQYWQFISSLEQDKRVTYNFFSSYASDFSADYWVSTLKSLDEFNAIVGFDENGNLPKGSVYNGIYGAHKPVELNAELCMLYILDAIGQHSYYKYGLNTQSVVYNGFVRERFVLTLNRNFDVNVYLTPQVREWIEKYMLGTRAI